MAFACAPAQAPDSRGARSEVSSHSFLWEVGFPWGVCVSVCLCVGFIKKTELVLKKVAEYQTLNMT